jgi:enoyl-CoA hydratase
MFLIIFWIRLRFTGMLVRYEKADGVAKVSMDDGKVNVMSSAMLRQLTVAFERAETDGVIVILTSAREGIFSAGFDTKILGRKDPQEVFEMVRLGAELAARVLAFPRPVVAACPGHAYPMGAFLLLASDIRIGADGPYRIGLNEVAIGIPVPTFGLELARHRLLPAYLQRTALTGEMFAPSEAMTAGFLDRVVAAESLQETAAAVAAVLGKMDFPSHASTKERLRRGTLATVRAAIDSEITLENYRLRTMGSTSSSLATNTQN